MPSSDGLDVRLNAPLQGSAMTVTVTPTVICRFRLRLGAALLKCAAVAFGCGMKLRVERP